MNIDLAMQAVNDAFAALLRAQAAMQPNVVVTTSADLQPALNAALPGDTIELAVGWPRYTA